jgi:hypothetical protein
MSFVVSLLSLVMLYNDDVPETKVFRLTESVKAAG